MSENKTWKYQKIPKIMFTYWYGTLPYLNYLSIKSFIDLNPDWKVQIYIPLIPGTLVPSWKSKEQSIQVKTKDYMEDLKKMNIDFIPIDFEKIGFYNSLNEIIKSDFLRIYILSTQGGLWSDADILYFKPMTEFNLDKYIMNGKIENIDTVISETPLYYTYGFLLSAPNNPFYKHILNNILKKLNIKLYQSIGVSLIKKLFPSSKFILNQFPNLGLANIGFNFVYPFKWNETQKIFFENVNFNFEDNDNPFIGIHWYNGSNNAKNFINNDNYDKNVTINNFIKKYKLG